MAAMAVVEHWLTTMSCFVVVPSLAELSLVEFVAALSWLERCFVVLSLEEPLVVSLLVLVQS